MQDDDGRVLERDDTQPKLGPVGGEIVVELLGHLRAVDELGEVIWVSHNCGPAIAWRAGDTRGAGMVLYGHILEIHVVEPDGRAVCGEGSGDVVFKLSAVLGFDAVLVVESW